ncbi:MAG: aminodeoxychorismate/anthranilate synthase component II [Crocinitomicaceae bacterium]|nr:aminodeoxychorismate/anthranilate synthase component II [Crocinitomicaceae bacterium]
MKVLLLDSFDSFTYNLFHYLEGLNCDVKVARNNEITLAEIEEFDKIILSPGPGLPHEAGILMELLQAYGSKKPILGVCLGMQAIALHFGGSLYNLKEVKHGVAEKMQQEGENVLFKDIPKEIEVGLYHSWAVDEKLPSTLKITARSENGILMAIAHRELPVYAVQFHPESILTPFGRKIIQNFIELQ